KSDCRDLCVKRKVDGIDRQGAYFFPGCILPEGDLAFSFRDAAAGEEATFGSKGKAVKPALLRERKQFLAGLHIPQADHVAVCIAARRQSFSVRSESEGPVTTAGSVHRESFPASCGVPQEQRFSHDGGHQVT